MLHNLIEYYELLADDRHITLLKVGEFSTVKGDKGLLQRLFANLISNAIYYSKSNSIIRIRVNRISTNKQSHKTDHSNLTHKSLKPLHLSQPTLNIVIQNELAEPTT